MTDGISSDLIEEVEKLYCKENIICFVVCVLVMVPSFSDDSLVSSLI